MSLGHLLAAYYSVLAGSLSVLSPQAKNSTGDPTLYQVQCWGQLPLAGATFLAASLQRLLQNRQERSQETLGNSVLLQLRVACFIMHTSAEVKGVKGVETATPRQLECGGLKVADAVMLHRLHTLPGPVRWMYRPPPAATGAGPTARRSPAAAAAAQASSPAALEGQLCGLSLPASVSV